jgi:peptide/nickel transport system substrate-binding protein
MKTSLRYLVITILLVSAMLVGCGPKDSTTPTLVVTEVPAVIPGATNLDIPSSVSANIKLDPATTKDTDTLAVSSLVYESLIKLDASGNPQPALAITWTVSDDQLDYVLDLRQNVTFHSGEIFNADAVLTNFNRWFDPADPLHGSLAYPGWEEFFLGFKGDVDASGVAISPFDGIEKVDDYNVIIHLNRPVPDLLAYLAQPYFSIIDPLVLEAGVETLGTSVDSVSGTGAYTVSAWTDSGLVLTPYAGYWDVIPTGELQIGWK